MASTKVITQSEVRFSFPNVFVPKAVNEGDTPKYGVSILIPKTDTKLIEEIKAAIELAKEEGKATKFGGKIPVNLKQPLRDGDEDRPDDAAYQGMMFVNANSATQPGVVDKQLKPIMTADEFYAGCWGKASITFYAYATKQGAKGIACGLQNLMKTRDDDKLAGGSSAAEDFGAEADGGLV
jgi:hypothetical protein